jgi:serine/threonine-protein kinase TTK/MPS1
MKKVKFQGQDESAVEGYKNEISLLNLLKGNAYIIDLVASEIKDSQDALFMIMEYGECDLAALVRPESKTLPMSKIITFWNDMLKAVQAIHTVNIIHSDLKPAVKLSL